MLFSCGLSWWEELGGLSGASFYKTLIPFIGEGNGTPFQYSCLENPTDGEVWWAAVHGVAKSRTRMSNFPFTFHFYALEKEMATHSSVLAWRIPGSRTRLSDLAAAAAIPFIGFPGGSVVKNLPADI